MAQESKADKRFAPTQMSIVLQIQKLGGATQMLKKFGKSAIECKFGIKCNKEKCGFLHPCNEDEKQAKIEEVCMTTLIKNMCPYNLFSKKCPHEDRCFLWHMDDAPNVVSLKSQVKIEKNKAHYANNKPDERSSDKPKSQSPYKFKRTLMKH
jgi:hypothetical protein